MNNLSYPHTMRQSRIWLVICLSIMLVVVSCNGTGVLQVPTPSISELQIFGETPVQPGNQIGISVEVNAPGAKSVSYKWGVENGGGVVAGDGTSAIIYQASQQEGTVIVSVEITVDGQTYPSKSIFINVKAIPTEFVPTITESSPTNTPAPMTPLVVTSTDTPISITNTPPLVSSTPEIITPPGPPSVAIVEPTSGGQAHCPIPEPDLCIFPIRGTADGFGGAVVRIWVKPVNPTGDPPGSWYLQANPIHPKNDGNWSANLQIGNTQYPAHTGDTLKIAAWLVTLQASEALDTRVGAPTLDPEGINSYLAKSSEIDLVVNRNK